MVQKESLKRSLKSKNLKKKKKKKKKNSFQLPQNKTENGPKRVSWKSVQNNQRFFSKAQELAPNMGVAISTACCQAWVASIQRLNGRQDGNNLLATNEGVCVNSKTIWKILCN